MFFLILFFFLQIVLLSIHNKNNIYEKNIFILLKFPSFFKWLHSLVLNGPLWWFQIRVQQYDWGGTHDYPRNIDQRYEDVLKGDHSFNFSKHHDLVRRNENMIGNLTI